MSKCEFPTCSTQLPDKQRLCVNHKKFSEQMGIALEPKKEVKGIAKVSDKMKAIASEYKKVSDEFLKENPVCQYPGCDCTVVQVHHSKGRTGKFLWDKKWFRALCWPHHLYCETHPKEAKELGLSFDRLKNE